MQHRIAEAHLFTVDRLIEEGIFKKVDSDRPNSPHGKQCVLITCGDLNHRQDQQTYWERKLTTKIHIHTPPGGAVEFSPLSPRNRKHPGDFQTRIRDLARIITVQKPEHILLVGHFPCGSATSLDSLDPVAIAWHAKNAKQAIIKTLASDPNIWQPKEADISCYLHYFAGDATTGNIIQERTMWFITHGLLEWVEKHDPTLKAGLLA
ncbi:MAG: hypothetical protein A3A27_00640 [Candidatus Wildermuthbacteria bacterium RIFCSPLOWO2_01_FULL_47_18]|uniref:Uncharacterized protein n=2 Tax=Candidatus Wildermuthiibacteriota TaxID=1817923 RepID=A0A1G2RJ61_9BACT|nr:MAG: hypothetical protein A3J68_00970 [Candidatus Wildermuthbacteria bacterium RIFCSPHIGHO2_02_FULL_48_16]OHA72884.1 MAG: hypothetical protein A3A27_00640 [Candidatus Wildermuthbacteria bacterium RIFCSPLOWO2_01_FULL_47_18]